MVDRTHRQVRRGDGRCRVRLGLADNIGHQSLRRTRRHCQVYGTALGNLCAASRVLADHVIDRNRVTARHRRHTHDQSGSQNVCFGGGLMQTDHIWGLRHRRAAIGMGCRRRCEGTGVLGCTLGDAHLIDPAVQAVAHD